jgi:DNA-binding NtrC family response regulator
MLSTPRQIVPIARLSRELRWVYDEGVRAAREGASICICGQEGTGKDTMVTWLHAASPRAHRPLVPLVCHAIPWISFDERVFGSRFTGATVREGMLETANGGTVFFDEIAELEIGSFRRLRAAIETGAVIPDGAETSVPLDVRVFGTTSRDFKRSIHGRMHNPEYLNLFDLVLAIPPLRERRSDIRPLAERFIADIAESQRRAIAISPAVMTMLESYAWPVNVLELRHCIEHAAILCKGSELGPEHLPAAIGGG